MMRAHDRSRQREGLGNLRCGPQAARSYSWMSPPSTSRRRTRTPSAGGPDRAVAPASSARDLDGAWPGCSGRCRREARAPDDGGRARASSPGTPPARCGSTARRERSPRSPDRGLDDPCALGASPPRRRDPRTSDAGPGSRSGSRRAAPPTARFRACCVTHAESGFLLTPRIVTRRVAMWIANNTKSV